MAARTLPSPRRGGKALDPARAQRRRSRGSPVTGMLCAMAADLVISYDGTSNDDDALALGKLLAQTGSSVALAYVRHSKEFDPRREEVAQFDAEQRLERGAALLGGTVAQHVVVGASTGEVLGELAQREGAAIIVFGSEYRTPLGRAEPGTSAQRLLE